MRRRAEPETSIELWWPTPLESQISQTKMKILSKVNLLADKMLWRSLPHFFVLWAQQGKGKEEFDKKAQVVQLDQPCISIYTAKSSTMPSFLPRGSDPTNEALVDILVEKI